MQYFLQGHLSIAAFISSISIKNNKTIFAFWIYYNILFFLLVCDLYSSILTQASYLQAQVICAKPFPHPIFLYFKELNHMVIQKALSKLLLSYGWKLDWLSIRKRIFFVIKFFAMQKINCIQNQTISVSTTLAKIWHTMKSRTHINMMRKSQKHNTLYIDISY